MIFYIREGASVERSVSSIRDRLNATPLVLQLPIGGGGMVPFEGVVDLLTMELVKWDDPSGKSMSRTKLTEDSNLYSRAMKEREMLIEQLAELDDGIMQKFLEGDVGGLMKNIQASELKSALRRIVLSGRGVPVFCGTSLKNRGVQPGK